jgi:dTDP-4-amino-4,6-dideoxygalactose transaminase
MQNVPPTKYYFPPEKIEWALGKYKEILETGAFLTNGKYCMEFEEKYARYNGSKYAVSTSNGTSALEAMFTAIDVKGFDVIVPTNTFAATAFAVVKAGGRPVFADCTHDLTVDPEDVERRITERTKAVVTVHIGGLVSPNTYDLTELCEKRGLQLVEDAAHAHGSELDKKKAGTFGIAGGFSFFSTKVMTTGEGGMMVTDDEEICEKARLLRDQSKAGGKEYHEMIGSNWRMTEFQALLGIVQLELLDKFIEERNRVARIFDKEFENVLKLKPLEIPKNVRHNFYKYVVFAPKGFDREALRQKLKKEYGVSLSGCVYELPCHLQPIFKEQKNGNFPVSEDLCTRHICPPIYATMKDDEAVYVVDSIRRCLS